MIVHQPEKRDLVRGQPGVAVTVVAGQPMTTGGGVNAMGVATMAAGTVAVNAMGAPMQSQLQPGMSQPANSMNPQTHAGQVQNVVPGMQMNMTNMTPMPMAQMPGQPTTTGHDIKYDR